MFHVEHSFGTRFGYLRWLQFLRTGECASFAEIARAVGRTGPAVSAWMRATDAPTDYRVREQLTEYFGEAWLLDGGDKAPEPELWKLWLRHRRADAKPLSASGFKRVTRADVDTAKKNRGKGSA